MGFYVLSNAEAARRGDNRRRRSSSSRQKELRIDIDRRTRDRDLDIDPFRSSPASSWPRTGKSLQCSFTWRRCHCLELSRRPQQ